ncbi:ABC transporter permease subunit [Nocardioides albidus]|uniref:ABC transporter permease subunit n=1 Tax=Nocardioides albidus TaxID=1517589 RepID=A0A5C4VL02_9ACTN|nr:ABC transporter permease subunit [Nocardioides albidus]TNM36482.1 ABC transporter permease subunit [Nocardioides albidus]
MRVRNAVRRSVVPLLSVVFLVAVWWLLSGLDRLESVLPSPLEVVRQMREDLDYYPRNAGVTISTALQGFLWGNAIAIGLVVLTLPFRRAQALIERVAVGAVALPLIAVAPVLAIAFQGDTPGVILAAQAVIFPTTVAAILGLRSVDRSSVEIVRAAGGSSWTAIRKVRIPAAIPQLVAGLQIAAPSAILGAIIGEYMGGTQGLGVAMIQAQGSFQVERVWGLALVTTAIAAVAYAAIPLLAHLALPWSRVRATVLGARADHAATGGWRQVPLRLVVVLTGTAVSVLAVWWAAVQVIPGGEYVARGPGTVLPYLTSETTQLITTSDDQRSSALGYLAEMLGRTVFDAGIGFVIGLLAAVVMAVLAFQWPFVDKALMPVSIALRSVPIVAAMPLLAIVFGRGLLAITVLVTIMTFFPTLVNLLVAMRAVPASATDLFAAAGAGRVTTLRKLYLPHSLPALLASIKVALPLSIGAAMVAEWLATGNGLGAAMTVAATVSDYNFVWAGVVVVLFASLVAYHVAAQLEQQALKRMS